MDPISFLGGTVLGVGAVHAARRLQTSRAPREGLGDLLGWTYLIDEGIILIKDGSFLAGFELRGSDLESASAGEVNQAAKLVHDALAMLGDGYSLEVNVHRMEAQSYPFPARTEFPTYALEALDSERRSQFMRRGAQFETRTTMLITYTPPKQHMAKWERTVVHGASREVDYEHLLQNFRCSLAEFSALICSMFAVRPLDSQALVTECHESLTGLSEPVGIKGASRSYLNYSLASCDFVTGFHPVVGEDHVFVCTITGLGAHTTCLAGDFFNRLCEKARWHMRFVGMSRHGAHRRIRRLQTRWFHQRGGLRKLLAPDADGFEDQDAAQMQLETGGALAEAMSGRARFGYFTNTILLRDDQLRRGLTRAQALMQTLRDQGFTCMMETVNATDAFIGSLPGHGNSNLRRPLLSSRNVAHLFPLSVPWTGTDHCPNPFLPEGSPPLACARTRGNTPFFLNLHQDDVGHTLVIGATGAGKSVLVGFLALSFLRYPNSRVHVFDIGRSHLVPCLAAGGAHFDFGSPGAPALQPLRHIEDDHDRTWGLSWIESIYELAQAMPDASGRLELSRTLNLMSHMVTDLRTLTALHLTLPLHLQDAIERYTSNGPFGRFVDGKCDLMSAARMQVYELGQVLELGDAALVPVLTALFRRIERTLDGSPTLIIIEEAWAALLRTSFAERIKAWLLTLRKRNASVVIVAHSPTQISALPNAALITESCPTKILLPNPEAHAPDVAEVYRALNMNEREIALIADAQRKRDYYYKSPGGNRLFELDLGPLARLLLMPIPGMSASESHERVRAALDAHGEHFIDHFGLQRI